MGIQSAVVLVDAAVLELARLTTVVEARIEVLEPVGFLAAEVAGLRSRMGLTAVDCQTEDAVPVGKEGCRLRFEASVADAGSG